jgi:stearoyl-CoA desaturase (delta-9 desaturase)
VPGFSLGKTECDADTVKAIITHRYYVLAQYTGSVKDACRQEIRRLKQTAAAASGERIDARSARALLRWLRLYTWDWRARRPITVDPVVRKLKLLHTAYTMRQELSELWSRSSASTEQLLAQLRDWRERAEASGIAALREFAHRLPHLV